MDDVYVKVMRKRSALKKQYACRIPMFCDVGLVLCRKTNDGILIPIPKVDEIDLLAEAKITHKTLFDRAFKATRIIYPFNYIIKGYGIDKMFIVSSCQATNGAIYAFADKVADKAARVLKTDRMFVSFLSEHEAIFQKAELTAEIIKKTLIDMCENPPLSIYPMFIQKKGDSKWTRKTVKTAVMDMSVVR